MSHGQEFDLEHFDIVQFIKDYWTLTVPCSFEHQ